MPFLTESVEKPSGSSIVLMAAIELSRTFTYKRNVYTKLNKRNEKKTE